MNGIELIKTILALVVTMCFAMRLRLKDYFSKLIKDVWRDLSIYMIFILRSGFSISYRNKLYIYQQTCELS